MAEKRAGERTQRPISSAPPFGTEHASAGKRDKEQQLLGAWG